MHARTAPARALGDHEQVSPARAEARVLRYLTEMHERERAAVPEIEAQIKAAPDGDYRAGLRAYLDETRRHAALVASGSSRSGTRPGRSPASPRWSTVRWRAASRGG